MLYKRKGEMQTRSSKRQKTEPTMVVYRGLKPEMKHGGFTIAHVGVATSNRLINEIAAGPGINERIGTKIKIHHIEFLVANTSGLGTRVTFLLPRDASAAPSLSYTTSVDRDRDSVLLDKFYHGNTTPSSSGFLGNHKLPMGIVSKYASGTGTSINSNSIYMLINTAASSTVLGYVRIWYTDA